MITHDTISARAPGRVELLGNHTDYNQGVVLGAAINRVIRISGRKNQGSIRVTSAGFAEVELHPAELRPLQETRWANYILGVADELRCRRDTLPRRRARRQRGASRACQRRAD